MGVFHSFSWSTYATEIQHQYDLCQELHGSTSIGEITTYNGIRALCIKFPNVFISIRNSFLTGLENITNYNLYYNHIPKCKWYYFLPFKMKITLPFPIDMYIILQFHTIFHVYQTVDSGNNYSILHHTARVHYP